jgi:hypothetical protein
LIRVDEVDKNQLYQPHQPLSASSTPINQKAKPTIAGALTQLQTEYFKSNLNNLVSPRQAPMTKPLVFREYHSLKPLSLGLKK